MSKSWHILGFGLALASVLTGCAGSASSRSQLEEELETLVMSKKCDEAEALARANPNAFAGGPGKMTRVVGAIYAYCGRRDKGIAYLKLAARQGDTIAAETLIDLDAEVPAIDRRPAESSRTVVVPVPTPQPSVIEAPISDPQPRTTNCRRNGPTVQCTTF